LNLAGQSYLDVSMDWKLTDSRRTTVTLVNQDER
jgi:hypothetical protein